MSHGGEAITESSNMALAMNIADRSALALAPNSASSGRKLSKALSLMYKREMESGPVLGAGLLEKKRPQWTQRFVQEMRYRVPQWVRHRHFGRGMVRLGSGVDDDVGVSVGGGVVTGVGVSEEEEEEEEGDEGRNNLDEDDGDGGGDEVGVEDVVLICTMVASGSGGGGSGESGGVINDGPRSSDSLSWRWSAILRPIPLRLPRNVCRF
ncbi:hypothetical protein Landi51_01540 [Colletotrichum acutatum]